MSWVVVLLTKLFPDVQKFVTDSHMSVFVPVPRPQRSGINSSDVEVLIVANVTEEDAGEYTCQVSNYLGQVNQSGWLTVLPGKLQDVTPVSSHRCFWVVVVIRGYLLSRCGVFLVCFYWWIFSW